MSTDEKRSSIDKQSAQDVTSGGAVIDFGGDSTLPPPPKLSEAEERRVYRKIDMRLLPVLTLMYLFAGMDRGNIGNARLVGLEDQLHLVGNQFNIAPTMFFIPYCLFEFPANLVIKKFRPSRWMLPGITIAWGTVMTLMALVKTYPQLVGTRVCLGTTEAGLFPGVVYYLSMWYPRHKLQYRIGLFFGAGSLAGAFSGLLAFGIGFMDGVGGLEGWSWIFLLEGLATVLVGVLGLFVFVDFPITAAFLTPEEKAYVIWKKKYDNSSVGEQEHFAKKYIWAAFCDWQVYLHVLVYLSIIVPLYSVALFLPSIISGFGFSTPISQLLTVPPYVVATIVQVVFSYYSDKVKMRSPFIYTGLVMLLIGFAIQISGAPRGAKYFGTFLCASGSYASFAGTVTWLGNNLSGQYKRAVGVALQIGIGNFGGAIASNIFRTRDAPRYILAHGIALMFIGIGLITIPVVALLYNHINARRDAHETQLPGKSDYTLKEDERGRYGYTPQELRDMGNYAPDFRYMI